MNFEIEPREQFPIVSAILVAAGSGTRFKSTSQRSFKQFLPLYGRPIFLWSLIVLIRHPLIDRVVVAGPAGLLAMMEETIDQYITHSGKGNISIIAGGNRRQDSVYLALKKLAEAERPCEFALIHDAVRPFLTNEMVSATIESVIRTGACTTAIPLVDTIKKVKNNLTTETIDRANVFQIQTPQAGKFKWLMAGHKEAQAKQIDTTDDAAVLELSGHSVSVVPGSPLNLKITNEADMIIAEAIATHFL